MRFRERIVAFVCLVFSTFISSGQVELIDDFSDTTMSNIWSVTGTQNPPLDSISETGGVMTVCLEGTPAAERYDLLGYVTTGKVVWDNHQSDEYVFSFWLSNIVATVTNTPLPDEASYIAGMALSSGQKASHWSSTGGVISLFNNYKEPENDKLQFAMGMKSPGSGTGMGTWGYVGNVTNLAYELSKGAIRFEMRLRAGIYELAAYDALNVEIQMTNELGSLSGVVLTNMIADPYIMLYGQLAGFGRGYGEFDKVSVVRTNYGLLYDDFETPVVYNFWERGVDTPVYRAAQSNGMLYIHPYENKTNDISLYLGTVNPLKLNLWTNGYIFRSHLSDITVEAGTGERATMFITDSKNDPWVASNSLYVAADYLAANDTLITMLYVGKNAYSNFGVKVFSGSITGFSNYAAADGLDLCLNLTNGLYHFSVLDNAQQPVSFINVTGSVQGAHNLAKPLTNAWVGIGGQNIAPIPVTGELAWAEVELMALNPTNLRYYTIMDSFPSGMQQAPCWSNILGSFAAGGSLTQSGALVIQPGSGDDLFGGYVTRDQIVMDNTNNTYAFGASLGTVTVNAAWVEDHEMRSILSLTPSATNDYWASPVAASLLGEYEQSDDRLTISFYVKTSTPDAFGQLKYRGIIENFNSRVGSEGPFAMLMQFCQGGYQLEFFDNTGAQLPLSNEQGSIYGYHGMGDLLATSSWWVAAQNIGSGRGIMRWSDAVSGFEPFSIEPDSNTNGIPDWWEQMYFGTPTGAVATADTDGDSQDNYEEYLAMTIPTNAESYFASSGANISLAGAAPQFSISWWARDDRLYTVESAEGSISNNMVFVPMEGAREFGPSISNQTLTITDTNMAGKEQKSYRIKLLKFP